MTALLENKKLNFYLVLKQGKKGASGIDFILYFVHINTDEENNFIFYGQVYSGGEGFYFFSHARFDTEQGINLEWPKHNTNTSMCIQ